MEYKNFSISELQAMIKEDQEKIFVLSSEVDKRKKCMQEMSREIYTRDELYAKTVVDKMLKQLETYSDQIPATLSNSIRVELGYAAISSHHYLGKHKKHRRYSYTPIISNIYFELGELIYPYLKNITNGRKSTPKFEICFNISKNGNCECGIINNVFTTSKFGSMKYKIQIEDIRILSKLCKKQFNKDLSHYNQIIPHLIESINSVKDGELSAAIVGLYLANV